MASLFLRLGGDETMTKKTPWLDRLLAGRRLNRFERSIAAAVFISILGNGLALTYIEHDRDERIEVAYANCVRTNERTVQSRVAIRRLADEAQRDGAPRFADALRLLAADAPLPVCKR